MVGDDSYIKTVLSDLVGDKECVENDFCPSAEMFRLEYLWIVSNKVAGHRTPESVEKELLGVLRKGGQVSDLLPEEPSACAIQTVVDDPYSIYDNLVRQPTVSGRLSVLSDVPMVDADNIKMFARNLGVLGGFEFSAVYETASIPATVDHCGPQGAAH